LEVMLMANRPIKDKTITVRRLRVIREKEKRTRVFFLFAGGSVLEFILAVFRGK